MQVRSWLKELNVIPHDDGDNCVVAFDAEGVVMLQAAPSALQDPLTSEITITEYVKPYLSPTTFDVFKVVVELVTFVENPLAPFINLKL